MSMPDVSEHVPISETPELIAVNPTDETDLSISMSMLETEGAEVTIDGSEAPFQFTFNNNVIAAEDSMNLHLLREVETEEARNDNMRLIIASAGLVALIALAGSLVYFSSKRESESSKENENAPDLVSLEFNSSACSAPSNCSFDRPNGEINVSTERARTRIREEWICVDGMVTKKVIIGR